MERSTERGIHGIRLAVALIGLAWVLAALPAAAALFVVNTTDDLDDGVCDPEHCSLREALQQAEVSPERDVISFHIPPDDGGVRTIQPLAPLPAQSDPAGVEINGLSQPGASAPTHTHFYDLQGVNLLIEIDGRFAGDGVSGLVLAGGPSVVDGLVVTHFGGAGVVLEGGGGHLIDSTFVGLAPSGVSAAGNAGDGITILAPDTAVRRSGISGNGGHGVHLTGESTRTDLRGNVIGGSADNSAGLENEGAGVAVFTAENRIGSSSPGPVLAAGSRIRDNGIGILLSGVGARGNEILGNIIHGNAGHGILVTEGADENYMATKPLFGATNEIIGNGGNGVRLTASAGPTNPVIPRQIGGNARIAIDLEGGVEDGEGVTANDPADADEGPNDLQNFPVLLGVVPCPSQFSAGLVCVDTEVTARPNTFVILEFYAGATCEGRGGGALATIGKFHPPATDDSGNVRMIALTAPFPSMPPFITPRYLAAITVEFPSGNSSEFSACLEIPELPTPTVGPPLATPTATLVPIAPTGTTTPEPPTATPTSFASTPAATATPPLAETVTRTPDSEGGNGDANCDSRVSVADVTAALGQIASASVDCGADLDGDGDVTEADLRRLIRALFSDGQG